MRKTLFLLLSLLMFATACGGGGQDPAVEAPEEQPDEAQGDSIEITGKEYSFDVPSTVEGGFVELTFKNNGKLVHEAAFVKTDPEAPQDQFIKDFKAASGEEGGPIAAHLKPYFVSEEVKAGGSGTVKQSLPAGTYYVVCTLTDADSQPEEGGPEGEAAEPPGEEPELPAHFEQGMIKKVTVEGPSTVALPEADSSIVAKEYTFDVKGLKAGKNEVLFRNDGPGQIHMAVVLEFPEGTDEAKARESFASEGPPPPGTPEPKDVGFGGVFDPGGGSLTSMEFKKDRLYGIACFIQDRAGGPPHVAKGMVTFTKVT